MPSGTRCGKEHGNGTRRSHGSIQSRQSVASGAEAALVQVGEIGNSITEHLNNFAVTMAIRNDEAKTINQSTAAGSAARMLHLASEVARDITSFSDNVVAELPRSHAAWEIFESNFTNMASSVDVESEEDREAAEGLLTTFDELRNATGAALEGIEQSRGQIDLLRGVNARLNTAVRRLNRAMDALYEEFSAGESILIRTRNLLEQELEGAWTLGSFALET